MALELILIFKVNIVVEPTVPWWLTSTLRSPYFIILSFSYCAKLFLFL